jgi:hypothetical protein
MAMATTDQYQVFHYWGTGLHKLTLLRARVGWLMRTKGVILILFEAGTTSYAAMIDIA